MRIWKYHLAPSGETRIDMPEGARVLAVQNQQETLCLWAVVDPTARKHTRSFHVELTGFDIGVEAERGAYLGTVQFNDGAYVVHVFEEAR